MLVKNNQVIITVILHFGHYRILKLIILKLVNVQVARILESELRIELESEFRWC